MLPSYKRFFYQWDDSDLSPFQWRMIQDGSYELVVPKKQSDEVVKIESFWTQYPIKVSDPLLASSQKSIKSNSNVKKLTVTQDRYYTSVYKEYWDPEGNYQPVPINTVSLSLSSNLDGIAISEFSKPSKIGIITLPPYGTYKVTYQSHTSPTLRSIKDLRATSSLRVQGDTSPTIHKQQLIGNYYSPLPANSLSDLSKTNPETIAYSLYLLLGEKDDDHLINLLNQVSSLAIRLSEAEKVGDRYQIGEGKTPGLPRELFRWQEGQPKEDRVVYQHCLLGLSVLEAFNHLYNNRYQDLKQLSGTFDLEDKLLFLLDQIGIICSSACDEGRVDASSILTEEGYFLADDSLFTTCLCSLFLTELLQVKYQVRYHTTALKLHQRLVSNNLDFDNLDSYGAIGLTLWYIRFFQSDLESLDKISKLLDQVKSELDNQSHQTPFFLFAYSYILSAYPEASYSDDTSLESFPFIDLPPIKEDGLYRYNNESSRLVDQTTMVLLEQESSLLTSQPVFPLWQEEVYLYLNLQYKEATRLLPKGDKWFQPEALQRQDSIISSLFRAYTDATIPSLIESVQRWKGSNVEEAVGNSLEVYSQLHLRKPKFSYDTYWNQRIKKFLEIDNNSLDNLSEIISYLSESNPNLSLHHDLVYQIYDDSEALMEKTFDPTNEEDIISLTKNGSIQEVLSLHSNRTLDQFEDLSLDSDFPISRLLNQPLDNGISLLSDEVFTIPTSDVLGHLTAELSESFSVGLLNRLLPIGIQLHPNVLTTLDSSFDLSQVTSYLITDPDSEDLIFTSFFNILSWGDDYTNWADTYLYWR